MGGCKNRVMRMVTVMELCWWLLLHSCVCGYWSCVGGYCYRVSCVGGYCYGVVYVVIVIELVMLYGVSYMELCGWLLLRRELCGCFLLQLCGWLLLWRELCGWLLLWSCVGGY